MNGRMKESDRVEWVKLRAWVRRDVCLKVWRNNVREWVCARIRIIELK